MPLWAWLVFIVLSVWTAFRFLQALAKGHAQFGPFKYSREDEPVWFWIFTALNGALFAFLISLLSLVVWKTFISR
jgi:RsiW-degrading membrane proteinase PrsW (M82 family)